MARIERRQRLVLKVGLYGSLQAAAKLTIVIEPGKPMLLGREKKYSNIALNDNKLSRKHLSLEIRDGGVLARDLETKNGTEINGAELTHSGDFITPGDMIRIGKHLLIVDKLEKLLEHDHIEEKIVYEEGGTRTEVGKIVSGYGA